MTARVKQSRCALAFSGRPPDAKWRQSLLFAVLPSFFSSPSPLGILSDHLHHRDPQTTFSSPFFPASLYSRTSSLARKPLHPASGPVHFFCSRGRQLYDGVQITTLSHDDGGSFAADFFGGTAQLCLRCRSLCQLKMDEHLLVLRRYGMTSTYLG